MQRTALERGCVAEGTLYTIGFTKKSAETFFNKIKNAGVKRVIDIRLNNVSQLAGFAKRDDLKYFLINLCNCDYYHQPALTPTKDILDDYRKKESIGQSTPDESVNLYKDAR